MRMVTPEVAPSRRSRQFVEVRSSKAFGRCARRREEVEGEISTRRVNVVPKSGPKRPMNKRGSEIPAHKNLVEQE